AVGKAPVAVISYDLWKRNFNGDSATVGSSIKLNNRVYTIIGIAPRGFTSFDLSFRPEIFVPMSMIGDIVPGGEQLLQSRHSRSFVIRSRIRPGVKISAAQAEADVICTNLTRQYPDTNKDTNYIVRKDIAYRTASNGTALPAV